MTSLDVAAGVGVVAGGVVQSAIGFGYSLVAAPLLFATIGPEGAVGLLMVLGIYINLTTLFAERRRPQPVGDLTAMLLLCAVPGMAAGTLILQNVSDLALQLLLTSSVVGSLVVRSRSRSQTTSGARWQAPLAGFAAGALTTSTGAPGPPVVLVLLGRGFSAVEIRDTLTSLFLGISLVALLVLVATSAARAMPQPQWLMVLIPLTFVGQALGRPLFARLAAGQQYELVLTVVLLASAGAGLVIALG